MSARQVRKTVRALLEDPDVGLKPTLEALVLVDGADNIVTDFHYVPGKLTGKMLPSGQPNIAVAVRRWNPEQKVVKPQRDAFVTVEIRCEVVGADQEQMENQIELTAIAVVKCFDGLREYSDANGGTILDVQDPFSLDIGAFDGPITTDGFVCSATILERSAI